MVDSWALFGTRIHKHPTKPETNGKHKKKESQPKPYYSEEAFTIADVCWGKTAEDGKRFRTTL
jgi:hypothetical protein